MSALGQKQTSAHVRVMFALPPKADILRHWAVRPKIPKPARLKILPEPERDEGQDRDDVKRNGKRA